LEQALAFGKTLVRIGIRIDKNIAVIERGKQPDRVFTQHSIAKHVARHVADTNYSERRFTDINVHFAEVPLHGLPGTARGDAHDLVVIARRPA
jgi:hypothetical protein